MVNVFIHQSYWNGPTWAVSFFFFRWHKLWSSNSFIICMMCYFCFPYILASETNRFYTQTSILFKFMVAVRFVCVSFSTVYVYLTSDAQTPNTSIFIVSMMIYCLFEISKQSYFKWTFSHDIIHLWQKKTRNVHV